MFIKAKGMNDSSKTDSQNFLKVPDLQQPINKNNTVGSSTTSLVSSSNLKVPWKIVVLGDAGVGKSCLIKRFLSQTFSQNYNPTVEDCYLHDISLQDGITQVIEILDTSGYYSFPAMRELNIKVGTAFILVFDLTNEQSLKNLTDLRESIVNIKKTEQTPLILLGTKLDIINKQSASIQEKAAQIARDHFKCQYIETSAKENINIEKTFATLVDIIVKRVEELALKNAIPRRSSSASFMRRLSCSIPSRLDASRRFSESAVNELINKHIHLPKNQDTNENNGKMYGINRANSRKKHCIIS